MRDENASLEPKRIWLSLWRQWINIRGNLCMILKHNLSLSLVFFVVVEECKCRQKVYVSLPFFVVVKGWKKSFFMMMNYPFDPFASYFKPYNKMYKAIGFGLASRDEFIHQNFA